MGEWAFPFADVDGDRMYSDTDFSNFYANLFTNGVFATIGTALQIRESSSLGMRVRVGSGGASINGRQYLNTEEAEMTIPVASPLQDREDSVVIRLNLSERTMKLFYKQADVTVVRTDTTYEMQLARIKVLRNATQITNANITDTRADPKVCGYSSPFGEIKTGDLLAQFKSELEANGVVFSDWFENIKGQLSEDAVGNLQNEIDNLTSIKADDDKVVHLLGDEDIAGKKTFVDIEVTGVTTERTVSSPFTWEYGLTGTLRRTGNVVEWIINRNVVSGSNPHEQSAGAAIPAGFRPIERAYVTVDLTNSNGFVPWAVARIDSNGNTYLTNNKSTAPASAQAFGSWKTNDPWPEV